MKKLAFIVFFLLLVMFAVPTLAKNNKAPGHWELVAPTGIVFTCGGGTYPHTLDEVTSNDPLMGYGHYDPNSAYTWDLTGYIDGNDVSFTIDYTGLNPNYVLHLEGTVAEDGSITGTSDGNCQTFMMEAGSAVWKGPAPKVDVCHVEGNCSYHLINVSENALPAHLEHGDGQPGADVPDMEGYVFDEACNPVLEPIYVLSSRMYYNGAGGWAGWSCPANHTVVDGGYLPETAAVAVSMAWKSGASVAGVVYPNTPFGYTYTPPEEGWIVQDGGNPANTPEYIYLWCLPGE